MPSSRTPATTSWPTRSPPPPPPPTRLDRQFDPGRPNEAWTADITYVPTAEGWLYLVAIEDLYSRAIVGWAMGDTADARLVVDALDMAVARRRPGPGLMAHSDRGCQYTSGEYQRALAARGMVCSLSRKGNCWDNAPMESFFASLKKEVPMAVPFPTRSHARREVFEYIEVFYNWVRRHSKLGYIAPAAFEARQP